ncbi:MAG: phytanoyl-CoA dioxygenase family protein [Planctomycetota bacterium]|nr:phytanoyl-CoA dioxygenase family protein [Planctomycetota bacterium]
MTTAAAEPATATATATATRASNGHFSHAMKGKGNTVYDGPIEGVARPAVFDLEAAIEGMYTDGYCVVPNALSTELAAETRRHVDASGGPDEKYEVKNWCFNKQLMIDWTKDAYYLRYLDLPGVIDVLDAVLGPDCHLQEGNTWTTGPGRKMGLHIDHLPLQIPEEYLQDPRVRIPIYFCPVMIYLVDMKLDLGPTIVVPGSHRSGRGPNNETTYKGVAPKAALVKAGDAVIFRFDLWHGAWGNTNTNGERRYVMQLTYGHRQTMPNYPRLGKEGNYSQEVLDAITPRQRRLLCGAPEAPRARY